MKMNRREMLNSAAAFALLMAETDKKAFAEALQEAPRTNAVDVSDYWSNFYDGMIPGQGTRGGTKGLALNRRKTLYLHCADSLAPLNYAENLDRKSLPKFRGDVLVKMAISQYRPGHGDLSTDITHLRIDASQSFDYMNLIAPLSWAAIASFTPDSQVSKLPTIDQLGYQAQAKSASDEQNLRQITLTNGIGHIAINVTRPANVVFTRIVQSASVGITSALSMMTLPAISVPAIKVFSELFGKWQQSATVVMNGNLTPVIATSELPSNVTMTQDPMPLTNGYYVMYPEVHKDELTSEFPKLTVQNGFLVYKDAPAADDLQARASSAVPGVSYVTLRLYVSQAPSAACGKTGAETA